MTYNKKINKKYHITDKFVKELSIPAKGNKITYDDEIKGFGVRITSSGHRSFILNYTIKGRERRFTIGSYGDWSVAAARVRAKELRCKIDLGTDPQAAKEEERNLPTVTWLYKEYEKLHMPTVRFSTRKDLECIWRVYLLPALGHLHLKELTSKHVDDLHRQITADGHSTRANRVIEKLRAALNHAAIRWDIITKNPASGFKKNPEEAREVYLTEPEIDLVLQALTRMPNQQAANAIRMLLLTGARRGEVLNAEWTQFDLERGLWFKPSSHTKQKRKHELPLHPCLVDMLKEIRSKTNSPYVFPSAITGRPIHDFRKPWAWLKKTLNLGDFRVHDIRHTVASLLLSHDEPLAVVGKILGHTDAQTTLRYAHLSRERAQSIRILGEVVNLAKYRPLQQKIIHVGR